MNGDARSVRLVGFFPPTLLVTWLAIGLTACDEGQAGVVRLRSRLRQWQPH